MQQYESIFLSLLSSLDLRLFWSLLAALVAFRVLDAVACSLARAVDYLLFYARAGVATLVRKTGQLVSPHNATAGSVAQATAAKRP